MDKINEATSKQQMTPSKPSNAPTEAHLKTPTPSIPLVSPPENNASASPLVSSQVQQTHRFPVYTAVYPYSQPFAVPYQPQPPYMVPSVPPGTPAYPSTPKQTQPPGLHEHGNFYTNSLGQRTSPRKRDKCDASVTQTTEGKQSSRAGQGRGKGSGRGSRTGANARKGGGSDDEIKALPDQIKKDAELVIPKKRLTWDGEMTMKVVQYLVAPERWDKIVLNLRPFCTKIAQEVFEGSVTSNQVYDRWTNVFRLYKDTKRHLGHTGGGDGDAPTEGPGLVIDSEDETVSDVLDSKAGSTPAGGTRRYSNAAMSKFAQSDIFEAIDKVASGRADVERVTEFSSHRKTEDIDADLKGEEKTDKSKKRKNRDDSELDDVLGGAVKMIAEQQAGDASRDHDRLAIESDRLTLDKKRAKKAEEYEAERLTIERERNKHEEVALAQRLRIEKERYELEMEEIRQKREREAQEESIKKLDLYNRLSKSENRLEQALARKMEVELVEQLDLKSYM